MSSEHIDLARRVVVVYRTVYWYQRPGAIAGLVIGSLLLIGAVVCCIVASNRRKAQAVVVESQPVVYTSQHQGPAYEQLPLYNTSSTYGSPTNAPYTSNTYNNSHQTYSAPSGPPPPPSSERLGVYSNVPVEPPKTNDGYYKF